MEDSGGGKPYTMLSTAAAADVLRRICGPGSELIFKTYTDQTIRAMCVDNRLLDMGIKVTRTVNSGGPDAKASWSIDPGGFIGMVRDVLAGALERAEEEMERHG